MAGATCRGLCVIAPTRCGTGRAWTCASTANWAAGCARRAPGCLIAAGGRGAAVRITVSGASEAACAESVAVDGA